MVFRQAVQLTQISGVDGPIVRQYLDGSEVDRSEVPSQFEVPTLLTECVSVRYLSLGSSIDWNRTCTRHVRERGQNGWASIHVCKFTFRAGRNRFFRLGDRLLHLGWSGLVWFSEEQSRSQPDAGLMGFLDAWVHA